MGVGSPDDTDDRALTDTTRRVGRSFAWRSAAVFLAVGLATHFLVRNVVEDHFRGAIDFHAEFVVRTIIEPTLAEFDAPTAVPTDRMAALREQVRLDEQVLAVEILVDDEIVLTAGRDATTGAASTPTSTATGVQPVVTTLPLAALEPPATARVVQDWTSSARAADDLTRTFDLVLLLGLLGLWGLLLPMANRLGSRLQEHTRDLEDQEVELRRLLDREQQTVARLEELNQLKDSFLSAVSHELRTPLTVVAGNIQTMRHHQDRLAPDRLADLLARTDDHAQRLDHLLTGILDLNHADEDTADHEPVDLAALVTETSSRLPPRALDVDLETTHVVGNRFQLERVVANLLGNAIRHAPGADPVHIRSRPHGQAVELTVSDRGPGVPDDLKHAIFEPFRQGTLRDDHAPGTGIGLSLVARFVRAHGGCTWVTDRPGGGATFHVRLPAVARAKATTTS